MQAKHWIAILAPYAIAAGAAIATELTHSGNVYAVAIGGIVLAAFSHRNLYADAPVSK